MTPLDLVEAPPERMTLPIGAQGPAFEGLLGTDGERHGFSLVADREVLVLIFSSNRCPTAKAYADRMIRLQHHYGPRGVQVLVINSNDPHLYPDESYPRMIERAAEDRYPFPYLVDDGQHVARAYGGCAPFTSSSSIAPDGCATRVVSTTRDCRPG
jgi:peroxiredoxin